MKIAGAALALIALAAALVIPIMLGGGASLRDAASLPSQGWVVLATLVSAGVLLRALKLVVLARAAGLSLRMRHAFGVALGGDFCFLVSPAGAAGLPGTVYLLNRCGMPVAAATAVVTCDQVFDGVFFIAAFPIALALAWDPMTARVARSSLPVIGVALAMALALLVLLRVMPMHSVIQRVAPFVPAFFGRWRGRLAAFAAESIGTLRRIAAAGLHRLLLALACTALQWSARYGTLAAIVAALGYDVPLPHLFIAQAAIAHLAQWSGAPGGAGVTELLTSLALSRWMPLEAAASALLVWRAITLHLAVIAGAVAFAIIAGASSRKLL